MADASSQTYEHWNDNSVRTFSGGDSAIRFLLGGIGTGNVSLGARGQLTDWEIFNHPGKGTSLPFSFFALRCETESGTTTRVLESELTSPYTHWFGFPPTTAAGLPRMDETTFTGEYPVAEVEFEDEDVPVEVSLEAYTPFIPLNPEDSGLPVGIMEYTLSNPTDEPIDVSIAGSMPNVAGYRGEEELEPHLESRHFGGNVTEFRQSDGVSGLQFSSERYDRDELRYSDMTLAVTGSDPASHRTWIRGEWWSGFRDFWDGFRESGEFDDTTHDDPSPDGETDVGSVGRSLTLAPGESETVTFLLSWFVPNREHRWDRRWLDDDPAECEAESGSCCDGGRELVQNQYATRFDGSWDVAEYVTEEYDRLRGRTQAFCEAFFDSTLPGEALEAVSSQMTVARSTTCLWLENDAFLGYEGCDLRRGCCVGTCTHVWNYAQTLAYLFPSLEREMRRIDFEESTTEEGWMHFRSSLPLGSELYRRDKYDLPAADGQMGTIMRLYREWRISGDWEYLERLWPTAKRALEFAFEYEEWDPDEDGVVEGVQHNTYDIEFHGPNGLVGTWYLGALKASVEMARAIGDDAAADRYEAVFERGYEQTGERLFNGEYYEQEIEDVNAEQYQYGEGCLSDQLLGQWFARTVDLGDVLPPEEVNETIASIFEYNFCEELSTRHNTQRTYALNDETGLVLCSWPHGGQPASPFPYSDEVWTGIEYQVASHLIYEGMVEEGLEIVRAIRERHDGVRRNPWNEFECGNHYARAMASWAVYTALTGLDVDLREEAPDDHNEHGFRVDPAVDLEEFSCFWITGEEWGVYEQDADDEETIEVLYDASA